MLGAGECALAGGGGSIEVAVVVGLCVTAGSGRGAMSSAFDEVSIVMFCVDADNRRL